jgi:hypothetical protein
MDRNKRVLLTCVYDFIDPEHNSDSKEFMPGNTIRTHIVQDFFPNLRYDSDLVISLNNAPAVDDPAILDYVLKSGDYVVFTAVPKGSGKGGKNPMAMVAMLAVMVVASIVTMGVAGMIGTGIYSSGTFAAGITTSMSYGVGAVAGSLGGALVAYAAGAVVMIGGGLLVSSLFRPTTPDVMGGGIENMKDDPMYGFAPDSNPMLEGGALPILIGTRRIYPLIIGKYISTDGNKQYFNVLYLITGHKVESISSILVNDNPIEYYPNVTYEIRYGDINQAVIPYFNDTSYDKPETLTLEYNVWKTVRLDGNANQGFGVGLNFPRGLYYANDQGKFDPVSVNPVIEYRVNEGAWTSWLNTTVTETNTSPFQRYFRKDGLTTEGTVDIRLKLGSNPPTGTRYGSQVDLAYTQGIVYDDFTYPGCALLAIRGLATDNFTSMPKLSCIASRTTETIKEEDGTAHVVSITNPAWAELYLIQNEDDGCGSYPYNLCEYNDYLAWANYCTTKGYEVHIYFSQSINLQAGFDTVSQLGRGTVIQMGSKYTCLVDKPVDLPRRGFLFNMGNILKDTYQRVLLPLDERVNAVEVVYYDKDNNYERTPVELYADDFDEVTTIIRKTTVDLLGEVIRDNAIRYGRRLLNQNKYLTNTYNYEAFTDSLGCKLGDVVELAHDVPQYGISGRLKKVISNILPSGSDNFLLANGKWLNFGTSSATITGNQSDPDGGTNAYRIQVSSSGTSTIKVWTGDFVVSENNIPYSCQCRIKNNGSNNAVLILASHGAVVIEPGDWVTAKIENIIGTGSFSLYMAFGTIVAGDSLDIYVYHPQVEKEKTCQEYTSPATSRITLDRKITMDSLENYFIEVQHPDNDDIESHQVINTGNETDVIKILANQTWTKIPVALAKYDFGPTDRVHKLVRINRMTRASDCRRRITAMEYMDECFDEDKDIESYTSPTLMDGVLGLSATIVSRKEEGLVKNLVHLTWRGNAISWHIYVRRLADPINTWKYLGSTSDPYYTAYEVEMGYVYKFAVSIDKNPSSGKSIDVTYDESTPTGSVRQVYEIYLPGDPLEGQEFMVQEIDDQGIFNVQEVF